LRLKDASAAKEDITLVAMTEIVSSRLDNLTFVLMTIVLNLEVYDDAMKDERSQLFA